ncbi:hypothetical protein JW721_04255 [Candidatus Micrarchaeota archaeon]|nr:hypothetical protein [Candidatus Micrarchaeota archaeon]
MDYVALLEAKLGEDEAKEKMRERIEGFHGLLTREAAAKLVASELGLLESAVAGVGKLSEGMASVDLRVRVEAIGELRKFPSGAMLRTLIISDASGEGQLNFWGEDAKKAGGMHVLDTLEVRKGYVKMGRVNVGYKSTYSVSEKAEVVCVSEVGKAGDGGRFSVMGRVSSMRGMSEGGRAFVFSISDSSDESGESGAEVPVSLLASPRKGEHLKVGDSVLLEGIEYNGAEVIAGERSRLLLRKNRENIYRGELAGIEVGEDAGSGGEIVMGDGKRFSLGRDALIRFLNLKEIREDMDLRMLSKMKNPELLGKRVLVVFKDAIGGQVESAQIR